MYQTNAIQAAFHSLMPILIRHLLLIYNENTSGIQANPIEQLCTAVNTPLTGSN